MKRFIVFLTILITYCIPIQARQTLITNDVSGNPLFEFDIANGAGEYFAKGQNPVGAEFFWTLVPQHLDAIADAANYWAQLLGNSVNQNGPVKISMGIYNEYNDDATSPYGANGSGKTALINAIEGNTSDSMQTIAQWDRGAVYAQIRIGYLSYPWLDYMGQSPYPPPTYIGSDTSGWTYKPMQLLPNNNFPSHMANIIAHEIGHAMGIICDTYQSEDDDNWYFNEYDGVNLNNFSAHLVDSFGISSRKDQIIRLAASTDTVTEDFRIIEQGDSSLNDYYRGGYAFFQGPQTLAVLDGAIHKTNNPNNVLGAPINGFEGEYPELSHIELKNSMMSHQQYRNWTTYMEAELAILQDIGLTIDRKNFFGRSIYNDDSTFDISDNFYKRDNSGTSYLAGQYNMTPYTIGLHIYGTTNTVNMLGEVLSSGNFSAGIRVDGWNNKLTINSKIYSDGLESAALLVDYGKDHNIILIGELSALGSNGIGARFDFGDNVLGDLREYRGSYMRHRVEPDMTSGTYFAPPLFVVPGELLPELNGPLIAKFDITGKIKGSKAAIFISNNAFVGQVNIMRGAQIEGDIISEWEPRATLDSLEDYFHLVQYDSGSLSDLKTKLTFGYMPNANGERDGNTTDASFNVTYNGDIKAKGFIDIEIVGGNLIYSGTISGVSSILKNSNGTFLMKGNGLAFDGIFEQTAGTTEITIEGKMFGGQNKISNSLLKVSAEDMNYIAEIGLNGTLNHYKSGASSVANIGYSSLTFSNNNGAIVFDSYAPSSYKAQYRLNNKIDNGQENTVSFKNSIVTLSISDYKGSNGKTKYVFDNSKLDLRTQNNAVRTIDFPKIEVIASSLSISLFYSNNTMYSDAIRTDSGSSGKFYFGNINITGNSIHIGSYYNKIFISGGLQFYDNLTFNRNIGLYVYDVESSSYTGSNFENGYFWLKTKISFFDFLSDLNSTYGNRTFDMSKSSIKFREGIYQINESLQETSTGNFTVIGDLSLPDNSPMNTISGLISGSSYERGSLFKLTGNINLTVWNVTISDAKGENGSILALSNLSSAVFINVIVKNNESTGNGGAIYISKSIVEAEDISFINNSAAQKGGAIYIAGNSLIQSLLTIRASKRDVLFSSNKAALTSNDIYMDGYSTVILDAKGKNIVMTGAISASSGENYLIKRGGNSLIISGIMDFNGKFDVLEGKTVFRDNASISINELTIGSETTLNAVPYQSTNHTNTAEIEVLTPTITINNLFIHNNAQYNMSENMDFRSKTIAQTINIKGSLKIAIDLRDDVVSDQIETNSIDIENGAELIVKAYGIGDFYTKFLIGWDVNGLWDSGSIESLANKGEYEIYFDSNEGAYYIGGYADLYFSPNLALNKNQQSIANFLESIDEYDEALLELVNPFTIMNGAEAGSQIKRGLDQISGLIYPNLLSLGANDSISHIIYSNITLNTKQNSPVYKPTKQSNTDKADKAIDRRYELLDYEEEKYQGKYGSDTDYKEVEIIDNSKQNSDETKFIKSVWVNFNYGQNEIKSDDENGKFDLNAISFISGIDFYSSKTDKLGVFISYESKNIEMNLDRADVSDIRLGAYYGFIYSAIVMAKADLGIGLQSFDVVRTIDYYNSQTVLKPQSQFFGYSINGGLEAQFKSLLSEFDLKPFADIRLGIAFTPEISESNGEKTNLSIEQDSYIRVMPSIGFKSEMLLGEILLKLKLALNYLAIGQDNKSAITFTDLQQYGNFSITSIEEKPISVSGGIGFQYNINQNLSAGLNFNMRAGSDLFSYSIFGGVNFNF
jgi:predicted outer membrane repeat protein